MAYHDAQHLIPHNPPGGSSQDEAPEYCRDCGERVTPDQPCANCAEQEREARREARPPIRVQIVVFDTLVAEAIIEPEQSASFFALWTQARYRLGLPLGCAISGRADKPRRWDVPVGSKIAVSDDDVSDRAVRDLISGR